MTLTSLEVCAGAGGQALGLERAGFHHVALVENDYHACATLRLNRPFWNTILADLRTFDGRPYRESKLPNGRSARINLLSGGVPCPPFSKAGRQLGKDDERDLFPEMIRLAEEVDPDAVLIENVRGLLDPAFDGYRADIAAAFGDLGFKLPEQPFRLLAASDFGVPQLLPRTAFVALKPEFIQHFQWPVGSRFGTPTVGDALHAMMAERGWPGADDWRDRADRIAPTLVGGSKLHGGPDLGPTRARRAWEALGVNGKLLAAAPPDAAFPVDGLPSLTVPMAAAIQGFPPEWQFAGSKTHAYRQVGNAFPPPVAASLGSRIAAALKAARGSGHD